MTDASTPDEHLFNAVLAEIPHGNVTVDSVFVSPAGPFDLIMAEHVVVYRRPDKPADEIGYMGRIDYRRGGDNELQALLATLIEEPSGDPASFKSIGDAADSVEAAQWWLLFAVMVANKPAEITVKKLNELLGRIQRVVPDTPFNRIAAAHKTGLLRKMLEDVRSGQYTRIAAAFRDITIQMSKPEVCGEDPRTWPLHCLEGLAGVGPKTARWFYLLVNPEAPVAALDTHVLKFLRDQGHTVPKGTPPPGATYQRLETAFVGYAEQLGMKPRDLDFFVWATYRNGGAVWANGKPVKED